MQIGKILAIRILEKYKEHCETTIDAGEDADVDNLVDVKLALDWVRNK